MKYICYLDGNALCIVKKDFKDLQESPSVFIDLTRKQIKEIKDLKEKKNKDMKVEESYY